MSVQPALAEAVALTEMQMEAFEGAHWERQLIQPFTSLKKKRKALRPLFVGCFVYIMPQDQVFNRCPHATDSSKSGYIRGGNDIGSWGSRGVTGIGLYCIIHHFSPSPPPVLTLSSPCSYTINLPPCHLCPFQPQTFLQPLLDIPPSTSLNL